jgi:hypothetical protein
MRNPVKVDTYRWLPSTSAFFRQRFVERHWLCRNLAVCSVTQES